MIYNNFSNNNNLLNTIIDYNKACDINFKEICLLFKISEEKLNKVLNCQDVKYLNDEDRLIINKILNSKNDEVNKLRRLKSEIRLEQDIKLLKDISNIIKKHNTSDKRYFLTDDDINTITKYRILYNISRSEFSIMSSISYKAIYNAEKNITDPMLLKQLEQLSASADLINEKRR